jgi:hypothetical protein
MLGPEFNPQCRKGGKKCFKNGLVEWLLVKHLPSQCKALSSTLVLPKQQQQKNPEVMK